MTPGEEAPQHPRRSTPEIEDAARLLAENIRMWRGLLFAHTADADGYCHSCGHVRWPCEPRALAERAEQIHRAEH